jgi:hypothetical protein
MRKSGTAARQLADHYGCRLSEAIRRSLIAQRDSVAGVPKANPSAARKGPSSTSSRFSKEGNDGGGRSAPLKSEDQGF